MKRVYLADLFPKGQIAQVPYFYDQHFNAFLNKLMASGEPKRDPVRGTYYELDED